MILKIFGFENYFDLKIFIEFLPSSSQPLKLFTSMQCHRCVMFRE